MKLELDFSKYKTESMLNTYEFLFVQYMASHTHPTEVTEKMPTVYLFEELCKDFRRMYLERSDSDIEKLKKVEKDGLINLSKMMQIPYEKVLEGVVELRKNLGF